MLRLISRVIPLAVLVGLLATSALVFPANPVARAAPIHPAVLAELQASPDGQATFFVLMHDQANLEPAGAIHDWQAKGRWVYQALTQAAQQSQASLRLQLQGEGSAGLAEHVVDWQAFWIVNALMVRGDALAAEILSRQPGVAQILPKVKLEAPELIPAITPGANSPDTVGWNIRQINADDVWALGYRGEGMVVSNVDTGVDYTHEALVRQYRGNVGGTPSGPFDHDYNWFDPFWDSQAPQALPVVAGSSAQSAHGTHVMGTEAGDDGGSNQIGVAPGARWIAAYGCCPDNASLLSALQWQLAPTKLDGSNPNPDLRPHAIENSWGGPGGSLIFNQAVATLKAAGIFVVASAGNNGAYGCGSLGSPGDNPAMFNVGASTTGDGVSSISSRGPDPFSGQTGPDLVAPGEGVRSSVPGPGGGNYAYYSGTSMAGPHVAGAVALLWQANPDLVGRVDYTAEVLRQTAEPIYTAETCGGISSSNQHPNNSAGWGRLDVLRAVNAVGTGIQRGRLQVRVVDDQGTPLPGVRITVSRPDPDLGQMAFNGITGEDGGYDFLVATGPISVTAQLFGYGVVTATTEVRNHLAMLPLILNGQSTVSGLGDGLPAAPTRRLPVAASRVALLLAPLPEFVVQGHVVDATAPAKALAASIAAVGSPLTPAITDCTGAFSLTLPSGLHELKVEAVGYESQVVTVDLSSAMTQTFQLSPAWDYAVQDSRTGGVAFDWIDATGGSAYHLNDDDARAIYLPAGQGFSFYGLGYTRFQLNSNGFITFGQPHLYFHGVIPFEGQPNNAIYAYGEDLNPKAGSQYGTGYDNTIYTLLQGDRFVVQFNEVEHWSRGNPETFQMILDLATGKITLQYQVVSWPDFTTVGVEDAAGARGISYSYANSANLEPGLALRFTPVLGQDGQSCGS